MAVNWYWKHKVGEIHYVVDEGEQKGQRWKLELFGGNMMCAFIYRYKDENGDKVYNFFMWLNDIDHAKRILKDDKNFFKCMSSQKCHYTKIKLCVTSKEYKFSNKEMIKFAQLLASYGYKVELY